MRMLLNNIRWGLMDEKLAGEAALRVGGVPHTIVRPGGLSNAEPNKAKLSYSTLLRPGSVSVMIPSCQPHTRHSASFACGLNSLTPCKRMKVAFTIPRSKVSVPWGSRPRLGRMDFDEPG